MVSGNMVPSFPSSVAKLKFIITIPRMFTLQSVYSGTCRARPFEEDYLSRFLLKKFDVISIIIPITIKGIDKAANKSGAPEIPNIVLLNAIPKAKTQIPMNAITFPVRLNLLENLYRPLSYPR
ncbi:hypothetical protein [Lentibacillus salicampi]|uniref:hypothetical protein n=1 Tax=Lentibacillus salicampi TaxID=175306 RepID=UPI00143110FB|nr:hypothetical protein [Lentibacillus salicampi]